MSRRQHDDDNETNGMLNALLGNGVIEVDQSRADREEKAAAERAALNNRNLMFALLLVGIGMILFGLTIL